MSGVLRALTLLMMATLLACSGSQNARLPPGASLEPTFQPYLVFRSGSPATIALIARVEGIGGRRLETITEVAYTFEAGETLVAVDIVNRDERNEAWVLTSMGATSRTTYLHRISLSSLSTAPGSTVTRTDRILITSGSDGNIAGTATPTGCIDGMVASSNGGALALFDAGSGNGRCAGNTSGISVAPQVYRLALPSNTLTTLDARALPPGLRPGATADSLLYVNDLITVNETAVATMSFASFSPANNLAVASLIDLHATSAGFLALRNVGGTPTIEPYASGTAQTPTVAVAAGATRVFALSDGARWLTVGGPNSSVHYPAETSGGSPVNRTVAFQASDVTIDPALYALAVGSSGACLIDMLRASTATSCDRTLALSGARFALWVRAR